MNFRAQKWTFSYWLERMAVVICSESVFFFQLLQERVFRRNPGLLTPSCVTAICCDGPLRPRKQEGQSITLLGLTAQLEDQENAVEIKENIKAPHF